MKEQNHEMKRLLAIQSIIAMQDNDKGLAAILLDCIGDGDDVATITDELIGEDVVED